MDGEAMDQEIMDWETMGSEAMNKEVMHREYKDQETANRELMDRETKDREMNNREIKDQEMLDRAMRSGRRWSRSQGGGELGTLQSIPGTTLGRLPDIPPKQGVWHNQHIGKKIPLFYGLLSFYLETWGSLQNLRRSSFPEMGTDRGASSAGAGGATPPQHPPQQFQNYI